MDIVTALWTGKKPDTVCALNSVCITQRFLAELFHCRGLKLKVFLQDCSGEVGLPGYNSGQKHSFNDGLSAPMNGTVARVLVAPGQTVEEGRPLIIVEAMKMEHCIAAPEPGTVEKILFQSGDRVEAGAQLLTFEENEDHETV